MQDQIFHAARDDNLTVEQITHVTRIKKTIGADSLGRCFRRVEITRHQAWASHMNAPHHALRQYDSGVTTHFQFMIRQYRAAHHKTARQTFTRFFGRNCLLLRLQGRKINRVNLDRRIHIADCYGQCRLRHAIARQKSPRIETRDRERFSKALQDFGPHHVASNASGSPMREIKRDRIPRNAFHRKVISECRR